jgi:hypothetical protein
MQPYERRRTGALAGTTGSRTPAFPVQVSSTAPDNQNDHRSFNEPAAITPNVVADEPRPVGTAGFLATTRRVPQLLVTARRPENNDGVWVEFGGEKWLSAGMAVPFSSSEFIAVGEHAGFPVYARRGLKEERIYLPTRPGVIAPYRLKN